MASGVKVDPDCISQFTNLKMGKAHSYVLYRISDDQKSIVVEKTGDPQLENPLEELRNELLEVEAKKQCRYAILDFKFNSDKGEKQKIIMINWAPDNATIKHKMIHASSVDAFKKALGTGISRCFQASDLGDIEHTALCKELNAMDRS